MLSEYLTRLLAHALRHDSRPKNPDKAGLTGERITLDPIAVGQSNKLIARELGIAEGAVKIHVKQHTRELDVRSRVEAVVLAVERGMKA